MNLIGRKVTLRAIEERDLEFLQNLMNDPNVSSTVVGTSFPVSALHQQHWYQRVVDDDRTLRLIVETKKDGVVGTVIMGDFDWVSRVAHSTGIKLDTSRITESGIGLDAMITLFDYAFNELNLNRIEGSVMADNRQAMALNRLIGYTVEGTMRQAVYRGGEYHDVLMLGMLKEDFEKRHRRGKGLKKNGEDSKS